MENNNSNKMPNPSGMISGSMNRNVSLTRVHDFCIGVLIREICEGHYSMAMKEMIAIGISKIRIDADNHIKEMEHLGFPNAGEGFRGDNDRE